MEVMLSGYVAVWTHSSCEIVDGGKSYFEDSVLLRSVGSCEFKCDYHLVGSCNFLKIYVFSSIIKAYVLEILVEALDFVDELKHVTD